MANNYKLNILHIDMDAFYASCEELINPSLKNIPMAVGGISNKSIITTANYNARKFGVHSAMPVFIAKKKCPNITIVPIRRVYYKKKSNEVFNIVRKYAYRFEQVSIDEAYIDILDKNPIIIAKKIKDEIKEKTQLTCSIGISYNKFLAKLASDWNKPNGIKVIRREDVPDILRDLNISKIHGIGNRTQNKLNSIGIYKVDDLLRLNLDFLIENFGKQGKYIYEVIRGKDDRQIDPKRSRKSIGEETTFEKNTNNKNELHSYLENLCEDLSNNLKRHNVKGKTINLKIKTESFVTHTKSITLQEPIYEKKDLYDISIILLDKINIKQNLRLIGISVSNLQSISIYQLSFL